MRVSRHREACESRQGGRKQHEGPRGPQRFSGSPGYGERPSGEESGGLVNDDDMKLGLCCQHPPPPPCVFPKELTVKGRGPWGGGTSYY